MKSEINLTPWFPGDVKPVRAGVYQRESPWTGIAVYSVWDGEFWLLFDPDKQRAERKKSASNYQELPWRGIAGKPQ